MNRVRNQYCKEASIDNNKSAFTMIELVFVVVVLGILASLAIPRMERDFRQEAGDNILSAIRYTQHLALMDNKTNPASATWQRSYWSFGTQACSDAGGLFYYVGSDTNMGTNISNNEAAIDPENGLPMLGSNAQPCANAVQAGSSKNIFLSKQYGINNVIWAACNPGAGQHIAFDHMGRLHINIRAAGNNYATYTAQVCTIGFSFTDPAIAPLRITIQPETGYAQIVGQPDS